MKHPSRRIAAVLFSIALTASLLSGCKTSEKKDTSAAAVTTTEAATTTAAETTPVETTAIETDAAETTAEAETISPAPLLSVYTNPFVTAVERLNIRAEATTESAIIGVLLYCAGGEILEVVEGGEWYHIRSGAVEGYVSAALTATGEGAEALAAGHTAEMVCVTEQAANIRSDASADAEVIGSAGAGERFIYLADVNDFYVIEYNGGTAYVSMTCATYGNYLAEAVVEEMPVEPEDEASSESKDDAESTAETTEGASVAPAAPGANGHIVCIDPGHQQHGISEQEPNGPGSTVMKAKLTTGTAGCVTGNAEYQVNLDVSMKLKAELEARGYTVVMIRTTNDCPLSNAERAQVANGSGAEIFIRVHCNSLDNSSVTGVMNYAPSAANPYLSADLINASNTLAALLADRMCAATGAANKGVLQDDGMTGINWCQIPVTIVEMGFMSNPTEDQLLGDPTYQQQLATGMANGVDAYFGR